MRVAERKAGAGDDGHVSYYFLHIHYLTQNHFFKFSSALRSAPAFPHRYRVSMTVQGYKERYAKPKGDHISNNF